MFEIFQYSYKAYRIIARVLEIRMFTYSCCKLFLIRQHRIGIIKLSDLIVQIFYYKIKAFSILSVLLESRLSQIRDILLTVAMILFA